MARRPYMPSPTLLLNLAAVLLGAVAATGFGGTAPVAPVRAAVPADSPLRSTAADRLGAAPLRDIPADNRCR